MARIWEAVVLVLLVLEMPLGVLILRPMIHSQDFKTGLFPRLLGVRLLRLAWEMPGLSINGGLTIAAAQAVLVGADRCSMLVARQE